MYQNIKKGVQTTLKFVTVSFWTLSFLWLILFMMSSPAPANFWAFMYQLSIPVYYYFIILLLSLLLVPFYNFKYTKYLIVLPKITFDLFLIADYFVFKIYRFHIDMLFFKMAIEDFKGIGLSLFIIAISLLVILLIVAVNIWLFKWAEGRSLTVLKIALPLLLLLFLTGQLTHIWANEYKQKFIQQYTPYFPYYFPTTSGHLMSKLKKDYNFLIPKPVETPQDNFNKLTETQQGQNLFNYPLQPLRYEKNSIAKPNILIIALESWQADYLNPSATPFLDSLARQNLKFLNHFSSGNVTVSGIFGLLYGIHPVYLTYVQAKALDYPTLLTQALRYNNYRIGVYTSSNLDRFSIKAMMFPKIKPADYVNFMENRADINDRKVINHLKDDLKSDTIGHWFKFVFLTSSHHHYFYPDNYQIFKPVPKNSEGFIFNKNINPLPYINDYKNALRYEDDLLREVISILKQTGQYNNTLIIITGDHGEEFNDNKQAYWGHGSNFTRYQTQVPLLIHLPFHQVEAEINRMTGHIDVVPTILKHYLGVNNALPDYTSGRDLLDSIPHIGLILTSYKDKAYITRQHVYQTGLFVKSYDIGNISRLNQQYNYKALNFLRQEETHFLKSR